jgi:hypothetical protein
MIDLGEVKNPKKGAMPRQLTKGIRTGMGSGKKLK